METGQDGVMDHEIVAKLVGGASVKEIAEELFLSERTVRRRVAVLMQALGASSRFQAGYRLATAGQVPARPSAGRDDRTVAGGAQETPDELP